MKFNKRNIRLRYLIADLLSAYLGFFLFNTCRYFILKDFFNLGSFARYLQIDKIIMEQGLLPLVMIAIFWLSGFYNNPFKRSRIQEIFNTFFSTIIIALLIYFSLMTNDQVEQVRINLLILASLFGCIFFPVWIGRYTVTSLTFRHIRKHDWKFPTLIIGNSESAHRQAEKIINSDSIYGYQIIGFVDIPGETPVPRLPDSNIFDLEHIEEICKKHRITQCIIIPTEYDDQKIMKLLPRLFVLDLPIKIAADTFSIVTSSIRLTDIFAEPFVDISAPTMSAAGQNIKRLGDIILSSLALTLLAIPMLIVAIIIRSDSKGSIFYSQTRLGYRKRPFKIYKFRTMAHNAENGTPMLSHGNSDPRITRAGHWLRKYRIDEWPQFWNVIKGDMSLVGPRPEREFFAKQILEAAPYYSLIHQVRPGITSWGMVKYGYASTVEQMVKRARYDLIYISNMSLTIDTKILIYTIKTVFGGKGK